MSQVVELLSDDAAEFFAPASTDMIDGLVGQYESTKRRIDEVCEMVKGDMAGALHYFLEGNGKDSRYGAPSVFHLFQREGAIASLNAAFWSKALQLTDVLNYMPQARRDEWNKQINDKNCPEFEEETVRSTLLGLLNMRSQFLAERVDGIFRGLSGEHVTNSPAAFGKRMIVGYVLNEYHSENYGKCGLINDLRCVIAKFMGRDEPNYNASASLIRALKGRWGEWISVDGGALKIRLYKKGTAHIEVHPDMAWRLNATLAALYPMAIPPEFRTKPKRKQKEIDLIQRPLPFAVIELLSDLERAYRFVKQEDNWRQPYRKETTENAVQFRRYDIDSKKHALAEAEAVLESIGATKTKDGIFQFDYSPFDVISSIVTSGCIPDQKAFQFYPTPASLAEKTIEIADIQDGDACLEPSAGTGAIADLMPEDALCIEVSRLRCDVLLAKGRNVVCEDFLQWRGQQFDKIIMNPPFDQGRWKSHIEHASEHLKHDGKMIAILPASAKTMDILPGMQKVFHGPFNNMFAGTSVSVVILEASK